MAWRRKHVFEMTDVEVAVLRLARTGMKHADIAAELHLHANLGPILASAVDKERTAFVWDKQQDHSGTTSLSKARGRHRMDGTR